MAVPPVYGAPETVRPGVEAAPLAAKMLAAEKVCATPSAAMAALTEGKVIVVPSVPARVMVLFIVKVLPVVPPAIENPVALAVSVRPFTVVGLIAPGAAT